MKLDRAIRIGLAVLLVAVFLLAVGALLLLTDSALSLWQRLLAGPAPLRYAFVALFVALLATFAWLVVRLLRPRRKAITEQTPAVIDEDALRQRIARMQAEGIDADDVASELDALAAHRAGSDLSLALFGAVSTGKSSLAKALLPDADILISPLAGSTTDVARYQWQARNGATITLADLPGLEAVGGELDAEMLDEARRAHAVIFVTDGDLTRQQSESLSRLMALNKPLIVTLNKVDQYAAAEVSQLLSRIRRRIESEPAAEGALAPALIVTIAGGEHQVLVEDETGNVDEQTRSRASDISQLVMALEELLGGDLRAINALREQSLLKLAGEKLAAAETRYREQRAEQIIRTATRRAVIGALAAVTPGTDIVIQGYLGTTMTRDLCRLYGQQPRDLEIDRFLDLSQSRVGKALPVSLAVAGNGLKAFPGVGTIAGGLVHAVAYGLLFDAVGRGLAASLAAEGAFSPEQAASAVGEGIDEHLEQGVRRVAAMALEHYRKRD